MSFLPSAKAKPLSEDPEVAEYVPQDDEDQDGAAATSAAGEFSGPVSSDQSAQESAHADPGRMYRTSRAWLLDGCWMAGWRLHRRCVTPLTLW